MLITKAADFERPAPGVYIGVIADVVDLGQCPTAFGPRAKVRIVWILDKLDKQGQPLRAIAQVNASLGEKTRLYKIIKEVLGTAPPVSIDSEVLLGRANQLFITKETGADGKEYPNVSGILPLPAGAVVPTVPADFKRAVAKTQQTQTQQTQQSAGPVSPDAAF